VTLLGCGDLNTVERLHQQTADAAVAMPAAAE
jgi:hypothetical protein